MRVGGRNRDLILPTFSLLRPEFPPFPERKEKNSWSSSHTIFLATLSLLMAVSIYVSCQMVQSDSLTVFVFIRTLAAFIPRRVARMMKYLLMGRRKRVDIRGLGQRY